MQRTWKGQITLKNKKDDDLSLPSFKTYDTVIIKLCGIVKFRQIEKWNSIEVKGSVPITMWVPGLSLHQQSSSASLVSYNWSQTLSRVYKVRAQAHRLHPPYTHASVPVPLHIINVSLLWDVLERHAGKKWMQDFSNQNNVI